jgi:thiamine biosynthesis protein ThiI
MGDAALALVRFSGDVGIKARATRRQFERRLINNLRDAIASVGSSPRVHPSHDRVFVELRSRGQADALTRVFGVQSVSLVERRCGTRLPEIVSTGEELFRERVRGRRFAVRARRVGDRSRIPVKGGEVKRALGDALLPVSAGVDLDDPEVTVHLEILEDATCFLSERIPAHGGVPLGAEARAVALVSGGFDSAVAAWQILRRGVRLDYAFCNLGGAAHLQGVLRVVKVLADRWSYGTHPQLHVIDFEGLSAALQARTETRYWQVLLKRLMLRAAEGVVRGRRATAVVTGEAVAQVSSQTLQNLSVISQAASGLILRPLAGSNKEEIIELAERIGTFELSKVVGEYCAMVPGPRRRSSTSPSSTAPSPRARGSTCAASTSRSSTCRRSRWRGCRRARPSSICARRPSSNRGTTRARCISNSPRRCGPSPASIVARPTCSTASSASRAPTWPS